MFSPHPLAGGQHRNGILLHALHFCPASRAIPVPDVVVAPAKETTGPTSLTQTVKIWGDVLAIAMGDEHQGSWFSNDRPSVCGQSLDSAGMDSRQEEEPHAKQEQAGVHAKTVRRGLQVNVPTSDPDWLRLCVALGSGFTGCDHSSYKSKKYE